jgi:hypothetical protein
MDCHNIEFGVCLMISFQRALLGTIIPGLRCVLVGHNTKVIFIKYIFDVTPVEEAKDIMSEVGYSIQSDFVKMEIQEDFVYSDSDVNEMVDDIYPLMVFRRFEANWR